MFKYSFLSLQWSQTSLVKRFYCLSTHIYKQASTKESSLATIMKSQKPCCHLSKRAKLKVVSGDTVTCCLPYTAQMQSWIYLPSDTTVGTGANTHTPLTPILAVLDDVSIKAGVSDGLRCLPFNGEARLIHIVNGDILGSTGGDWRRPKDFS